jgi:hypothetical protein
MHDADLQKLMSELYGLLDANPAAAVQRARNLPEFDRDDGVTPDSIRAALFVDAAIVLKDLALVREARGILESILASSPARLDIQYNLANALSTECQLTPYKGPSWYLETLQTRFASRAAYQRILGSRVAADFRAQVQTNLGNELWRAHRWVEAYDAFLAALNTDPTNVVASTGAVKVLLRARDLGIGDPATAEAVAARHLRNAASGRDRIRELAGERAVAEFDRLQSLGLTGGEPPDLSNAEDYERFVADNRLMLAPTIEGLQLSLKRWDSLHIDRVIESTGGDPGVPPLFAIFNTAKAEYLTARWLFYLGTLSDPGVQETGTYHDTLDYAVYGIRPSLSVFAQRAALDVLDKIALLVTEYLGLDENPQGVYFRTRWHRREKKTIIGWHDAVAAEIEQGNPGFVALADVAVDLSPEGFLGKKKSLRDAGTHRALVLHDLAKIPSRESRYVTHEDESEFQRNVLETLRLARASLIYLIEGLAWSSRYQEQKHSFLGTLLVPSHHWVRGEESEEDEIEGFGDPSRSWSDPDISLKTRDDLADMGFTGFVTVHNLRASELREVPQAPGVYVFLRESDDPPSFRTVNVGGHFKGKDPTVPIDKLRAKWVPATQVVYIGKAGHLGRPPTLRTRLKQYLDFGAGKPVGHWGGRYVWQLEDSEDLVVCWRAFEDKDLEEVELGLITAFRQEHGCLPFANLTKGTRRKGR